MDQVSGAVEHLQKLNKFTTKTLSPRNFYIDNSDY